jgi:hypothetical protein
MSKKFEYELTLRLEKAEKAIASLASKIEKDLGGAANKGLKDLTDADNKYTKERIDNIRRRSQEDSEARKIRFDDHKGVLSRIEQAEIINAQKLAEIEARVTTLTKKELEDQLREYQKLARARIQYATEAGYKAEAITSQSMANGARGVSAIFQVQQGIEDAMYAGLRGAGNNIAFLLTKVTSSWVAIGGLIGVATLQLADHLGVFEKLNEAYDGALWKTKEQVRYEEHLLRLKKEQLDREDQKKEDEAKFSPASKTLAGLQDEIKEKKEILTGQRERQFAYERTIELVTELKNRQKELRGVEKAMEEDLLPITVNEKKELERRKAELENQISKLKGRIEDQKPGFTADELVKNAKAFEVVQEKAENFGSAVAKTTDEVKNLLEQLKPVEEASFRKEAMEWVKQETLAMLDRQIEQSKDVVKAREEELRTVQQTLATAEQLLKTEQNREDAIRKAASAREDEFAKQKLGLQNTILDMEASETAKAEKAKADSAKEAVASQMDSHRKWAEKQAQIDKFNNKGNSANIDAAKQNWLSNMQAQADAEIARIEANEKRAIESAKKIAEEAKKANLDAMEVVQKKKVEDLLEEAEGIQFGGGDWGDPEKAKEMYDDAQEALDKALKTLKEMADAKVGNLNQKDSVQQGKQALREWEELTERIKEVNDLKLEYNKQAQEESHDRVQDIAADMVQEMNRLDDVKEKHDELLKKKELISKTPMTSADDLQAIEKYRAALQAILDMRIQIANQPLQAPMQVPGLGAPGAPQPPAGAGGQGAPGAPSNPAPTPPPNSGMSLTFNMNNTTPNAVMAAAAAYQQNQRAVAMLSGN